MVKSEKVEIFIMNLEISVKDKEEEKRFKMRYRKEKCAFKGKLDNTKFCVVV